MAEQISDPTVAAFVAAINDGDRGGFDAVLAEDATMTDDGSERDLDSWVDKEIFSASGRMTVESEADGGRTIIANFSNSTWGAMRTRWQFSVSDGVITRFDTGQA